MSPGGKGSAACVGASRLVRVSCFSEPAARRYTAVFSLQARPCGTPHGVRAPTTALRWLITVANLAGELPVQVIVDGRARLSRSHYAWSAGGLVLTIATVLPEPGLAFELISTYTGHTDTDTIAIHLMLGQGRASEIDGCRHPHEQLNPVELARACAYDHASRLIEALGDSQHPARVELAEHTFRDLERVE